MCVVIALFIAKLNPVGISKCSASNPSRLYQSRLGWKVHRDSPSARILLTLSLPSPVRFSLFTRFHAFSLFPPFPFSSIIKGTVSRDFLLHVFFMNHLPPSPFRIFSKIRGDIRKSRCTTDVIDTSGKLPPVSTTPAANLPPVSTTPAANFATSFPCAVYTGGK